MSYSGFERFNVTVCLLPSFPLYLITKITKMSFCRRDMAVKSSEYVLLSYAYLLYFCAGVLYRDAGDITGAINAYEQCLKIDPDSRNAGQVWCIMGDHFVLCVL